MKSLIRRRRGLAVAGVATGTAVLAVVSALPAGASTVPSANTIIVGSGSQAAYSTLVGLDDLFNNSPGCDPIVTSGTQPLDFSCPGGVPASGSTGENGEPYANENPLNDVATQEPPLGANNGITQLEDQGTHGSSAAISYASSSRAAESTDLEGLNFVAYAKDGISWFHFTSINKSATPSAKVTNLSLTQLTGIWNGTITNWDSVGGSNAPIDVYVAQKGSGTETVWKNALGITDVPPGVTDPATHVIFQDSDTQIIANGDAADAIYYFSVGYYNSHSKKGILDGNSKKYKSALGSINGVAPTETTILGNTFPVTRYLYTVYSNGFNPNIPAANQATLNFASEDGFLCKKQTSTQTDPYTGATYRSEIDGVITSNGFYPLALGAEGTVSHPADITSPYYTPIDSSGVNPQGYCLVTTTDGNTGT